MANAQKPTPRTRHIDIKYFSLCDWVERDLILLEHIDTKINMSDHFTKNLSKTLFHRHIDYILGHIPPPYSPLHLYIIGTYNDHDSAIDTYVPTSFTAPLTATAARIFAGPSMVQLVRGSLIESLDRGSNLWLGPHMSSHSPLWPRIQGTRV